MGLPRSKRDTHPILSGPDLAPFAAQSPIVLAYQGLIVPPASPEPTAPTMATQDPLSVPKDTSVHDGTMEDLINRLINTSMTDSTTSKGIPDIVFQIKCNQEGRDKGLLRDPRERFHPQIRVAGERDLRDAYQGRGVRVRWVGVHHGGRPV